MRITTLIPCYNVAPFCSAVFKTALRHSTHLILVDDGSRDATPHILRALHAAHPAQVRLVTFSDNRGKGAALIEGMKCALAQGPFDVLITLDSDGQHNPQDIPRFAHLIQQGADFVMGERQFSQMPFKNRWSNRIVSFLLHRLYPHAPLDTQSGYRAFTPQTVERCLRNAQGHRYDMEFECLLLVLREGLRIKSHFISTVYLNRNRSSHFAMIADSIRILQVLWKHERALR